MIQKKSLPPPLTCPRVIVFRVSDSKHYLTDNDVETIIFKWYCSLFLILTMTFMNMLEATYMI